jgi:hypothetical protein
MILYKQCSVHYNGGRGDSKHRPIYVSMQNIFLKHSGKEECSFIDYTGSTVKELNSRETSSSALTVSTNLRILYQLDCQEIPWRLWTRWFISICTKIRLLLS